MQFDFQRVSAATFSVCLGLLLAAGVWGLLNYLSIERIERTVTTASSTVSGEPEVLSVFTSQQNIEQTTDIFRVDSNVPELTNSRSLVLFGYKQQGTIIQVTVNNQQAQQAGGEYESTQWEIGIQLNEGENQIKLELFDVQGLGLATQEYLVMLDTKSPTCKLNYPSSTAGVGRFRISLNCTEAINPQPKIYIDQPGSVDVYAAMMNGGGANWYFDYYVKKANGAEYIDGRATVEIVSNSDFAGNPIGQITNRNFTIATQSSTTPNPTTAPGSDGSGSNTDVDVLPETGNEDENARDMTERNEENSTVLPSVSIIRFGSASLETASYRNGSVILLEVEYSSDTAFAIDSKLDEYSYIGKSGQAINNGIIADFSELDSEYSDRAVRVSARREVGENRFARTIRYHISGDNSRDLPLEATVTVRYKLNGQVIARGEPFTVKLVPQSRAALQIRSMNGVDIDTTETPQMTTDVLAGDGYTLQGSAQPNATIRLQIFSDPIVVETVTDDQGNWEYTLTEELAPGDHTVYAALLESGGAPEEYVEVLSFTVINPAVALEVAADDGTVTESEQVTVSDVTTSVNESSPLRVVIYVVIATAVVSGLLLLIYRMRAAAPNDKIFTT